jgi:hypothetical protein
MDQITFNVTLQEGIAEAGFMRYEPSSPISGLVQIVPNQDVNARKAAVRLRWRTEGRGDMDSESIGETEIWQGNLVKGRPVQGQFSFQLPQQPWSYSGHYITIVWEIFVYVDVPLTGDPKFAVPFVVRPGGKR